MQVLTMKRNINLGNNSQNEKFETIAIKKISLDDYNFEHEIGFFKN